MEQTSTIHSVDAGFTYAFLSCHFPSNTKYSVLILLDQCFSNFLFHRPFFTLDTSFSPPSLIKQTQGSRFKEFYLETVLNSWTKPLKAELSQCITTLILGEGWVESTLFCIFNHYYFISSPNKLKICHTIKQLSIHNIMPKHENNILQKKFYNQFKKGTFSVECAPCTGHTRHEHGVHQTGQKKLGCMHCIMLMWYPM